MFDKILALSLNSHLEHTIWTESSWDDNSDEEYEKYTIVDKSLNICRALAAYGVGTIPILMIGEENITQYSELIQNYGIPNYIPVAVPGSVEIVTHSTKLSGECSTNIANSTLTHTDIVHKILSPAMNELTKNTLVIISGSLPTGISSAELFSIASELSKAGANLLLDTTELSIEHLISLKPWCIKLNLYELELLTKKELTSKADIMSLCNDICQNGIQNCIVSAGADGLYYSSADYAFVVQVPAVNVNSSIGAGDMLTAGFIYSMIKNNGNLKKSLCVAASFGTAACLTDGNHPPQKLSFASILGKVKIHQYMCCTRV